MVIFLDWKSYTEVGIVHVIGVKSKYINEGRRRVLAKSK
jgi:hypothetical protein